MNAGKLVYVTGDATVVKSEGKVVIPHVCNDIGAWGAGFVLALSKRWPHVEQSYRVWHAHGVDSDGLKRRFGLGHTDIVRAESKVFVANMVAQHGVRRDICDPPPIRMQSLAHCMEQVGDWTGKNAAVIQCPKFGCGLAGGKWEDVEELIQNIWVKSCGLNVYVYTL